MNLYDLSPVARHMVDLFDGLPARWRRDLEAVDAADDDTAFAELVAETP